MESASVYRPTTEVGLLRVVVTNLYAVRRDLNRRRFAVHSCMSSVSRHSAGERRSSLGVTTRCVGRVTYRNGTTSSSRQRQKQRCML